MTIKSSWRDLSSESFKSEHIRIDDLEKIISDAVLRDCGGNIVEVNYTDDGIIVVLDSGDVIEIEIDWNEIILV